MTLKDTLATLESLGDEKVRAQNRRQGAGDNPFGVRLGDIRKLAAKIQGDDQLAIATIPCRRVARRPSPRSGSTKWCLGKAERTPPSRAMGNAQGETSIATRKQGERVGDVDGARAIGPVLRRPAGGRPSSAAGKKRSTVE
jgi:hypothetical protein